MDWISKSGSKGLFAVMRKFDKSSDRFLKRFFGISGILWTDSWNLGLFENKIFAVTSDFNPQSRISHPDPRYIGIPKWSRTDNTSMSGGLWKFLSPFKFCHPIEQRFKHTSLDVQIRDRGKIAERIFYQFLLMSTRLSSSQAIKLEANQIFSGDKKKFG